MSQVVDKTISLGERASGIIRWVKGRVSLMEKGERAVGKTNYDGDCTEDEIEEVLFLAGVPDRFLCKFGLLGTSWLTCNK